MKRIAAAVGLGLALWVGAKASSAAHARRVSAAKYSSVTDTPSSSALAIIKGPTVEYISSHHAVISWVTNVQSTSVLHYGTAPGSLSETQRTRSASKAHRVELSKLRPEMTYYFKVTSEEPNTKPSAVSSAVASFKTVQKGKRPERYPEQH